MAAAVVPRPAFTVSAAAATRACRTLRQCPAANPSCSPLLSVCAQVGLTFTYEAFAMDTEHHQWAR